MKRVLSVQDLSCLGRCSLTVALPVLSAMGSRCAVLPTAVLSTHTGFPQPHIHPMTEDISKVLAHWQTLDVEFDAVCTGYLANEAQVLAVGEVVRHYRSRGSRIIVDPAMGDHGKLYRGLSEKQVQAMKEVCRMGDILLPNLTEAAFLTGYDYRETCEEGYLARLGEGLLELGASTAIITGVPYPGGKLGHYGVSCEEGVFTYAAQQIDRQFHGTGDLFAAVFTGALLQGKTCTQAAQQAADFVRRCVEATPTVTPHGVDFETQLKYLIP